MKKTLIPLCILALALCANGQSSYKPLMVGTTNQVLSPGASNFFGANSNALNAAIGPIQAQPPSYLTSSSLTLTSGTQSSPSITFVAPAMYGSYMQTIIGGNASWEIDQNTLGWYLQNLTRSTYPFSISIVDDSITLNGPLNCPSNVTTPVVTAKTAQLWDSVSNGYRTLSISNDHGVATLILSDQVH
jgi:hypothetical protein